MGNHFQLVLMPDKGEELSKWMQSRKMSNKTVLIHHMRNRLYKIAPFWKRGLEVEAFLDEVEVLERVYLFKQCQGAEALTKPLVKNVCVVLRRACETVGWSLFRALPAWRRGSAVMLSRTPVSVI
jgi:hypothetical protein